MKILFSIILSIALHSVLFLSVRPKEKKVIQTEVVRVKLQSEKLSKRTKKQNKKTAKNEKVFPQEKNRVSSHSSKEIKKSLKESYIQKVILLVEENKFYPPRAKRLKQFGKVIISLKINATGDAQEIKVIQKSKYALLNQAALELMQGIQSFPPLPKNLDQLELEIPIEYIN